MTFAIHFAALLVITGLALAVVYFRHSYRWALDGWNRAAALHAGAKDDARGWRDAYEARDALLTATRAELAEARKNDNHDPVTGRFIRVAAEDTIEAGGCAPPIVVGRRADVLTTGYVAQTR